MAKSYLRLIEPAKLGASVVSAYVIDYRHTIEWVDDATKATPHCHSMAQATQTKIKQQLNLDTELIEITDQLQMQSEFVICKSS
jgi:hypothetical protein